MTTNKITNKKFTIASFDIGVKNLAFCVISKKESQNEGSKYQIDLWKDISLIKDCETDYHTCQGKLKAKKKGEEEKVCGSKSKIKTDDGKYFCMRHNPDKNKYKLPKKKKAVKIPRLDMCKALINCLDSFPQLLNDVDLVVIEQQFKMNPTMITLSNMLYSYFVMKGVMVSDKRLSDVKFISSRNKYKVYKGPFIKCEHLKDPKAQRKWLAIKYCEHMIKSDEKWLKYLNSFPKKKDDLSDCFLQGAYYLEFRKPPKKKKTRRTK